MSTQPTYLTAGDITSGQSAATPDTNTFSVTMLVWQVAMIVLFTMYVDYSSAGWSASHDAVQYKYYTDVTVMMLVGFGYLMTFLARSGLGAVGYTFLITVICIPTCILADAWLAGAAGTGAYPKTAKITLDTNALLQGDFAAAAVLISFGALIGKLSPSQVVLLAIVETVLFAFNHQYIVTRFAGAVDMGGSIFIHMFGAYFGLAVSFALASFAAAPAEALLPAAESPRAAAARRAGAEADAVQKGASSYQADIFSLIGTVFLWIYWPSFNGATAFGSRGGDPNTQMYTTGNTVLSLIGATTASFFASRLLNGEAGGRIRPEHVQNATLAGGVAIGAASNLPCGPGVAMLIGTAAGLLSTWGFARMTERLAAAGVHDSCGVHNLHGMPSVFGTAAASAVCAASGASAANGVAFPAGAQQWRAELLAGVGTVAFAVLSGVAFGFVLTKTTQGKKHLFRDAEFWSVGDA